MMCLFPDLLQNSSQKLEQDNSALVPDNIFFFIKILLQNCNAKKLESKMLPPLAWKQSPETSKGLILLELSLQCIDSNHILACCATTM